MKKVLYTVIVISSLLLLFLSASCGGGGGTGGTGGVPGSLDIGTFQGRLLDDLSQGIQDATLRLTPGDYSDITDEVGYFSITAPANRYNLTILYAGETFEYNDEIEITKDGVTPQNLSLNIASGYIVSHPLIGLAFLKDTASIELSSLGYSPVSGASISLTGSSQILTTDASGYFKYDRVITGIQTLEVSYDNKNIQEELVVTSNSDISDLSVSNAIPENVTMLVGSVRQFTAYGISSKNELVLPGDVSWKMVDNIGTINSEGIFVAQNIGMTEVEGTFGGNTVSANVIVTTGLGNISGRVMDGPSGQPVSDVIVNVSGVNIFDVTDANGEFLLSNIPANLNVLLSVTDSGLLLASKEVFVIADSTVNTEITINPVEDPTPAPTPSSGANHPVNNSVLTTFQVGTSPEGIALSPDGSTGYAATELGTFVFSTSTNQVNDSIQIGTTPANKKIALSPDGSRVYVTNNGSDAIKLAIVNSSDNSISDELTVPQSPFDIAVSPDGTRIYVANESQSLNYVYVINSSAKSVIDTIEVDKIPHGLDISSDGTRLYVTSMVTSYTPLDRVSVIDTSDNSVLNTITVGAVPYEIALTPDDEKAYVTNSGSNTVSVLNLETSSVSKTISLRGAPLSVEISPDGLRAYVTHFDNYVSVIDTSSDTVITTINLSASSGQDVVFSPDGLRAYVTTSAGGGLVHVIY